MVDMGFIKATDKIVLAGHRQTVELEVETATNMYPGRVVKRGSTDNEMVVGAADELSMGWLSYEDTPVMYRPATIETIYVQHDRAAYVFGPGMVLVGELVTSGITMGDKLVPAADGKVAKWTQIVDNGTTGNSGEDVIAVAMQTLSGAGALILRSLI